MLKRGAEGMGGGSGHVQIRKFLRASDLGSEVGIRNQAEDPGVSGTPWNPSPWSVWLVETGGARVRVPGLSSWEAGEAGWLRTEMVDLAGSLPRVT